MKKEFNNAKQRDQHPPSNVEIREMEIDDLPLVYALGERVFTTKWPNLYRTWDEYELVELFSSDGDFCLVAEMDDRIIGFVLGSLIEKRRSAWRYGWLIWFGVEPEFKGKGVGTKLINELMEVFIKAGVRIMIVDTDQENHEAIRFFKKHGFGDPIEHLYLSRNLTRHPQYLRKKTKTVATKAKGQQQ